MKYATQPSVDPNEDYPSYASPTVKRREGHNVYENSQMLAFKASRDSIDSVKPRQYYLTNRGSPYKDRSPVFVNET